MNDKILLRTTANKAIRKAYLDGPYGQLHYWTAGKGMPFLLIHQSSNNFEEYAGLVPYLMDHYQLISYDWPGHGFSDDPDFELGVEEYTEAALAVLDHLDIGQCHVIGHHGGALLAMNLSYRFPERVAKVILSGTSGLKDEEESKVFKKTIPTHKKDVLQKDGASILAAWKRYVNYLPDAPPNEVLIPFLNHIRNRIRPYDAHRRVLEWDRKPAMESLKDKEVLLLQGALDFFVTKQETLLKILPNAQRKVSETGGMFMFYDKCEEAARMIRSFLDK